MFHDFLNNHLWREKCALALCLDRALGDGFGLALFIIPALDTPYTGSFAITAEPFQTALETFAMNP